MLSTELAPQPTRQAIEAKGRSAPGKLTGKPRIAVELMVWQGLKRDEAAAKAGMSDHGLREALRRPHVKAAYLRELDVLRTSERARNIHALVDVRDDKSNKMARVQAALALERLQDEQHQRHNGAFNSSPGLVIVVNAGSASMSHRPTIEAKPLESLSGGGREVDADE